jgi:hypothetical protein
LGALLRRSAILTALFLYYYVRGMRRGEVGLLSIQLSQR